VPPESEGAAYGGEDEIVVVVPLAETAVAPAVVSSDEGKKINERVTNSMRDSTGDVMDSLGLAKTSIPILNTDKAVTLVSADVDLKTLDAMLNVMDVPAGQLNPDAPYSEPIAQVPVDALPKLGAQYVKKIDQKKQGLVEFRSVTTGNKYDVSSDGKINVPQSELDLATKLSNGFRATNLADGDGAGMPGWVYAVVIILALLLVVGGGAMVFLIVRARSRAQNAMATPTMSSSSGQGRTNGYHGYARRPSSRKNAYRRGSRRSVKKISSSRQNYNPIAK